MAVDIRDVDGLTAEEWAWDHFECESCPECGGDIDDHDYTLVLGHWFAKCKYEFSTLDEMIHTDKYIYYEGDTVLNLQHRIINSGFYNDVESVTHEDFIEAWRDYLDICVVEHRITDYIRDCVLSEILGVEDRHIKADSILDEVFNLGGEN